MLGAVLSRKVIARIAITFVATARLGVNTWFAALFEIAVPPRQDVAFSPHCSTIVHHLPAMTSACFVSGFHFVT